MPFRFGDIPGVTPGRNAVGTGTDAALPDMFMRQSGINAQWAQAQLEDALRREQLAEQERAAREEMEFRRRKAAQDHAEWGAEYDQTERKNQFEVQKWETEDADRMRAAASQRVLDAAQAHDAQDFAKFGMLTNPALQPRGLSFGPPPASPSSLPPSTRAVRPPSLELPPVAVGWGSRALGFAPGPELRQPTPESIPASATQGAQQMGQVSGEALSEIERAVAEDDAEAAKKTAGAAGITLVVEPSAQSQSGTGMSSFSLGGSMVRSTPETVETAERGPVKDPLGDNDVVAYFGGQEIGRFNFETSRRVRGEQWNAFAQDLGGTLDDPLDRKAHEEASRIVGAQSLPFKDAAQAYREMFAKLRSGYQSGINAQEVSGARAIGIGQRQSQLDSNQFSEGARFMQARMDKLQATRTVTGLQSLRKLVDALQKPQVRGNRIFLTLQGNKLWRSTDDAAVLQNEREQLRVSGLPGVEEYLAGKLGLEVTEEQYNATLDTAKRLLAQKQDEARDIAESMQGEFDETDYPSEAYRDGAAATLRAMFRGTGLPGFAEPKRRSGGRAPARSGAQSAEPDPDVLNALDNPEE